MSSDDFIEEKPAPEDAKEGDEKGDGAGDGGAISLDEFEEKDEGERGADEGESYCTDPAEKRWVFSGESKYGEGNENEARS